MHMLSSHVMQPPIIIPNPLIQVDLTILPSTSSVSQLRLKHILIMLQANILSGSSKVSTTRPLNSAAIVRQTIIQIDRRALFMAVDVETFGNERGAPFDVDVVGGSAEIARVDYVRRRVRALVHFLMMMAIVATIFSTLTPTLSTFVLPPALLVIGVRGR